MFGILMLAGRSGSGLLAGTVNGSKSKTPPVPESVRAVSGSVTWRRSSLD